MHSPLYFIHVKDKGLLWCITLSLINIKATCITTEMKKDFEGGKNKTFNTQSVLVKKIKA